MGAATDAERVVEEFCRAFEQHDAEALRPFFTDDVVYHNMPMDPAVGVDAAVAFIDGFFGMCDSMVIENLHVVASGDVVLTERVDTFTVGDLVAPLPVMGTFELRDGRIAAWRDYFDLAQITKAFSGGA
jgi:limonene-1,2-epoxide hydrolase